MRKSILWPVLITVLLAACGGDGGSEESTVPTPPPATTPAVTLAPADTLPPPTPLPATWTPKASLTQPPRVTIDYTYAAPTLPSYVPPTYTPSPEPPSPTPIGPVLTISAEVITQRAAAELQEGSGGLYVAPPTIGLAGGAMFATWEVLTTPGDATTARPVMIDITVALTDGRIVLSKANAYFRDTTGAYTGDLPDRLIGTLQDLIDTLVVESYTIAEPEYPRFYVGEIVVTDNGILVQAVIVR